MKFKKILILNIFILLMYVFCINVRADISNQGTTGSTSSAILGSGSWHPDEVGIRATIVDSSGNTLKSVIIVDDDYLTGYNTQYNVNAYYKGSLNNSNIRWFAATPYSKAQPGYTNLQYWTVSKQYLDNTLNFIENSNILPDSWKVGSNFVNLYNYFDTTEEVKQLLNIISYNYTGGEYLLIEPMVSIGKYFGTAYELGLTETSTSCTSGSYCWDYNILFASENCLFCRTMFLESNNNMFGFYKSSISNQWDRYLHVTSKNGNLGVGVFKVSSYIDTGYTLTIQKRRANTGEPIPNVWFSLEGNGYSQKRKTDSNGNVTFYGVPVLGADKIYTLKETLPAGSDPTKALLDWRDYGGGQRTPDGPSTGSQPYVYWNINTLESNRVLTITNEISDCQARFNNINKNDMIARIALYNDYEEYNNLLNLNITDAATACSVNTSCNREKTSCLNVQIGDDSFNERNISCFTETVTVDSKTAYCSTRFDFSTDLPNSGFSREYDLGMGNIFSSGQFISLNNVTPLVNISRTCYLFGNDLSSVSAVPVENLNTEVDVTLNNKILDQVSTSVPKITVVDGSNFKMFKNTFLTDFEFTRIYSRIGSGATSYNNCDNCRFLGYGLISKLYQNSNDLVRINVPFTVRYGGVEYGGDDFCYYRVRNSLITSECDPTVENCEGDLEIEFRVIDTNNPFPGKSGSGRQVGSNWCEVNPLIIDCANDNGLISSIMSRNNSYNKNNTATNPTEPLYSITLTPSTILKIREYNDQIIDETTGKKRSYDTFELTCDEENNCSSAFLNELSLGKINGVTVNSKLIKK